jgi:hypothetical protein
LAVQENKNKNMSKNKDRYKKSLKVQVNEIEDLYEVDTQRFEKFKPKKKKAKKRREDED